MLDGLLEILATLDRHRFRTALTALAVGWGIFMLVVLLSAGVGLERGVRWEFRDDAINSVWIFRGRTTMPYEGHPPGRRLRFTNADYERIKRLPGVEHITARFFLWGDFTISWGGKTGSFQVRSCHPDHMYLEKSIITRGRFLNERDLQSRAKVTVIGEEVSKHLFGGRDPVGEWVDIKGISYRVVGEFHDDGGLGELQKVYVPITTAQTAYGGGDTVHMIMFTVGDMTVEQSNGLVDRVRAQLASVHHFDPRDRRALRIRNNLEKFQEIGDVLDMIRVFSWIVGLGTIAAGVVGVGNIMLVSVSERTSEIGLRKALGASPGSVVGQIVLESLMLTSVAGYAGLVAGLITVELVDRFLPATEMFRDPEVDLGMAFAAVGVLVLAGLVAGFVPAWRAARVDPVVALREGG